MSGDDKDGDNDDSMVMKEAKKIMVWLSNIRMIV
jgi:hypothetical protein